MQPDDLGFWHPEVNAGKCVECGACERCCPIVTPKPQQHDVRATYAGQLVDKSRLKLSQSGGAFAALATAVIKSGGVVYGAAMNADFSVSHKRAATLTELEQLFGSKYVQCNPANSFRLVLADLKQGMTVLFSGTPCQVAGLQSYIPEVYKARLLTVDIVCNGVPSPAVYMEYLNYHEAKNGSKLKRYIFRDKEQCGWRVAHERLEFENGKSVKSYKYNFLYMRKGLITNFACDECRWRNLHRPGDVTIADCWKWEKLRRNDFEERDGISLLLVNSEAGERWLAKCEDFATIEIDLQKVMQLNLYASPRRNPDSFRVFEDFRKFGFAYIHKKYGYTKRNLVRYWVIKLVKRVKKVPKKLVGVISR
jgi:coenzyme F420-reducing hydrogenase beta subunit